jgi:PAS domain S-box-containing protein
MTLQISQDIIARFQEQARLHGLTEEAFLRGMLEAAEGSLPLTELRYMPRIIESINEAFIALDRNMTLTYINRRGETLLRRRREELLGRSIWESFPEAVGSTFDKQYRYALETGTDVNFTEYYPPLEAWFEVRAYPSELGIGIFFVDVTRSKLAEMRLRESEARYRGIVESQIDLVCRYTPDTILTFVNDAYCTFFGKTREELIGHSFLSLGIPEAESPIRQRIAEVLADPTPAVAEYSHVSADGQERWVQWVDYGIVDESGRVTEIQAVGREVTRVHELEQERLRARELEIELQKEREVIELKERFISIVSHEFRTPLTVILINVELLERYHAQMSADQVDERLESVRFQASSMVRLLDELLLLGRAGARQIEFTPAPIDLIDTCQRLLDNIIMVDGGRHQFDIQMDEALRYVDADRRLLEHILQNLLTNAVKYSPPDTVIHFILQRHKNCLDFRVQDHGIGIPEADQAKIFQTFHRALNAQDYEGTGLGLAIARLSAEAHGGTITFSSAEGEGTTFTVRLPLVFSAPPAIT